MPEAAETSRPLEIEVDLTPTEACQRLRRAGSCSALLDGSGGFPESWLDGPLVAIDPRPLGELQIEALEELLRERRSVVRSAHTGLLLLCGYDLSESGSLVALAVDRSLRFPPGGRPRLTAPAGEPALERLRERLARPAPGNEPARAVGAPRTSLPRARYESSVTRILEHIACGDVYQANLCQRFEVEVAGDALELYARLSASAPAPRSAFVETPDFALVSISPETFLRVRDGSLVETWPIKGTRPRGATPQADRAAARELERSPKDAAELLMIVDLERNDLSRVCRAGSVRVPELASLRSYAHVHHLVARIEGVLREGVGLPDLLRATFPGGSITGAPKIRAMQILRELEPVPRGFFTGSLFWLPDDGRLDSSILIRTLLLSRGRAWLGAGGGIVADSDPHAEWLESNHKARAIACALGFDPEDAA